MVLVLALIMELTYDVFKIRKNYTTLRLGEERLSTTIKLVKRSVLKYWTCPNTTCPYSNVSPCILTQGRPATTTKAETMPSSSPQETASPILPSSYGPSGSGNEEPRSHQSRATFGIFSAYTSLEWHYSYATFIGRLSAYALANSQLYV